MTEQNPETPDAEAPDEDVADFDAFWTSQDRKGKAVRVAGEVVHLAPSLPLQFELEARAMQRSKSQADVTKMLGLLGFPADAMDRWAANGMDLEQFQVLLLWATRTVAGKPITMDEAKAEVAKAEAAKAAPGNSRARRQRN